MSVDNLKLLVIQPTSLCNLNCRYCYVPSRQDPTKMTDYMLESTIRLVLQSKLNGHLDILYHAGEPLTAGIEFYERAIHYINTYKSKDIVVRNVIQTNGILINDKWVDFFKKNEFKIGVSIDGPEFLHNLNRKSWSGVGSFQKSLRGYNLLKDSGVMPGVLSVITSHHLQYADELFNFYLSNKMNSVGFNVEEVENANVTSSLATDSHTVDVGPYKLFMQRIVDLWSKHSDKIVIREILDIMDVVLDKKNDLNSRKIPMETEELGILTIQKNGDITTYSPEFAGSKSEKYNNFIIGNVLNLKTLSDLLTNNVYLMIKENLQKRNISCAATCKYYDFCGSAFASNVFAETSELIGTETIGCILHRQTLTDIVISKLQNLSTLWGLKHRSPPIN